MQTGSYRRSHAADARRGVQQEGAGQVHRRLHPLVEDPDLCPVADADDVALDDHLVAGPELENLGLVGDREGDFVSSHQASRSKSTEPSGADVDGRASAAQHW